mmetsp:Transcript_33132/g.106338  ORF Transcript_33132/g.106338 Transcript_33132/m.106338 type:complete len:314 (+) Transcript_33132:993-1934(+)
MVKLALDHDARPPAALARKVRGLLHLCRREREAVVELAPVRLEQLRALRVGQSASTLSSRSMGGRSTAPLLQQVAPRHLVEYLPAPRLPARRLSREEQRAAERAHVHVAVQFVRRVLGILARLGVAAKSARAEPTNVDGLGVLVRVLVVSAQLRGIARRVVRGRDGARPTTPIGLASSMPVLLHRAAAPLAHSPVAVIVGPPASPRLAIARCAHLRDRASPATSEELREPHPHRECPELDVQRRCALDAAAAGLARAAAPRRSAPPPPAGRGTAAARAAASGWRRRQSTSQRRRRRRRRQPLSWAAPALAIAT